jgi:hypothetical protein
VTTIHPSGAVRQSVTGAGMQAVMGMATLEGKIYVVCSEHDTLYIFQDSRPYTRLATVQMKRMRPIDIVASTITNCLYLAEHHSRSIRQLNSAGVTVKRMRLESAPNSSRVRSLSVKSGRLLVITSRTLNRYRPDRHRSELVTLPRYMAAEHAVETTCGTFVVSHTARDKDYRHCGVSEVDVNGDVISVCSKLFELGSLCGRLAIHCSGLIVVADRANKRVLLLNADLELDRVMLDVDNDGLDEPQVVCLAEETSQLLVGGPTGCVSLYNVSPSKNSRWGEYSMEGNRSVITLLNGMF